MNTDKDKMNYNFCVPEEMEGLRLDKCISEMFDDISRSYISKIIKAGNVFLNKGSCEPDTRVTEADEVEFCIPEKIIPDILPENIPLDILYEDDDVIVVNKPKGMVVHPASGHYTDTLVNALMYHCKDLSGINGVMRPGIVHRIDRDTTGSIIACKNDYAHNSIAKQLREHTVSRQYVCIVNGIIKDDEGTVDAPIGRHPTDRKRMAVNFSNGKRAVTHYKVLERFKNYTYIECRLETGRTHQIRVHMSYIHHPLLGDEVYSPMPSHFHTEGQVLHAKTIGFIQPHTGKYIQADAPIPDYFLKILKILRQ